MQIFYYTQFFMSNGFSSLKLITFEEEMQKLAHIHTKKFWWKSHDFYTEAPRFFHELAFLGRFSIDFIYTAEILCIWEDNILQSVFSSLKWLIFIKYFDKLYRVAKKMWIKNDFWAPCNWVVFFSFKIDTYILALHFLDCPVHKFFKKGCVKQSKQHYC